LAAFAILKIPRPIFEAHFGGQIAVFKGYHKNKSFKVLIEENNDHFYLDVEFKVLKKINKIFFKFKLFLLAPSSIFKNNREWKINLLYFNSNHNNLRIPALFREKTN